jgi:hypothetical protein
MTTYETGILGSSGTTLFRGIRAIRGSIVRAHGETADFADDADVKGSPESPQSLFGRVPAPGRNHELHEVHERPRVSCNSWNSWFGRSAQ